MEHLHNIFKICVAILLASALVACSDKIEDPVVDTVPVLVTVERPADFGDAIVVTETITMHNASTGTDEVFHDAAAIDVEPGLYDVHYLAEVSLHDGVRATMQGAVQAVTVNSENRRIGLRAYMNIENDDLIIAEIYFAGSLQPSGNGYLGDDYIKLYNNTDHVIYADGLTFWESEFLTTENLSPVPDIRETAVSVHSLYTVPGDGTKYPVAPGEYLLIADNAIDHRVSNPNSIDLRHAALEWYDVSTSPTQVDLDNPEVPNMDKWYCYTQTIFFLHNRGFRAFGLARIPVDKDTYLSENRYTFDYELVTAAGVFPMQRDSYRLPNEWVVDAVNCSVQAKYAWNVTSPALDCGWTYCGTVDNDKTRYFHAVRRKLLRIEADGRVVLKDTNNSAVDFNGHVVPSEVELQGASVDAAGTACTTRTYDGVTTIE